MPFRAWRRRCIAPRRHVPPCLRVAELRLAAAALCSARLSLRVTRPVGAWSRHAVATLYASALCLCGTMRIFALAFRRMTKLYHATAVPCITAPRFAFATRRETSHYHASANRCYALPSRLLVLLCIAVTGRLGAVLFHRRGSRISASPWRVCAKPGFAVALLHDSWPCRCFALLLGAGLSHRNAASRLAWPRPCRASRR